MVKPVFAETAENPWPDLDPKVIQLHKSQVLENFDSHIFRLPQPVVTNTAEISSIAQIEVDGKRLRIYPPFPINQKEEAAGAFENAWIPAGQTVIEQHLKLPDTAIKGGVANPKLGSGDLHCHGLRIDSEHGADFRGVASTLIELIAQFTWQWWLRSSESPFCGPHRLGVHLDKNFMPMELLRYRGAGKVESPWYGVMETQTPLGFEKTLSEQIWLRVIAEVQQNLPADTGLLAFVDAIAAYVAGEDEKCVLNLCLCVEILGNKHRILSGSRDVDFIKIIKQSPLFENDVQRQLASRLFIDRGHIAHGRTPPYLASKDTPLSYVELVRNFVNCYLNSIKPGDWRKATTTVLGKTPKK